MIKRLKNTLIIAVLLIGMSLSLISCSAKLPEIDEHKERFVYLIEESKELNVVFFGLGLPVYRRDGVLSERKMVYSSSESQKNYNRIMENSEFKSIDMIKARAEEIFSEDYINELYESAFDGIMTGSTTAYVRFYDDGKWLHQNVNATVFSLNERIYDYSTMQVEDFSLEDYINVSVETYTLEDSKKKTVYLSFIFENGNWYLDTPTY